MASPPEGRRPERPVGRRADSRPSDARADDATLDPRERAALAAAVVHVGRRGRAPVVVAIVLAAFGVGLLRPWDLLPPARPGPGPVPAARSPAGVATAPGPVAGQTGVPRPEAPAPGPTCGYPADWRAASVQQWAGRRARVWSAAEAVVARGPGDAGIPFNLVAAATVEAIGWCAPVRGPDRPPLSATGTLYRLRDGVAAPVALDRLEPARPDALGELWVPRPGPGGRRGQWPAGRYVIRLATPTGTYERYLGLEVGLPARDRPSPAPGPSPRQDPP